MPIDGSRDNQQSIIEGEASISDGVGFGDGHSAAQRSIDVSDHTEDIIGTM